MSEHERDEGESRGFKVQDRRRFSATGEPRPEAEAEEPSASPPEAEPAARQDSAPDGSEGRQPTDTGAHAAFPDITFTTFTMSLSTQALVHLGEIEDPHFADQPVDLGAAKQLIDILGMLEEKTRGNLDENEHRLLDAILYDLRLRYVERAKKAPGA